MKPELVFNLNFDDFHPQYDEWGDFGGDSQKGHFKFLIDLLEEFPELKISLFTVPNWIDKPYATHHYYYHIRKLLGVEPVVPFHEDEPYRIDKHEEWCNAVRALVQKGRIELLVHGHEHYNPTDVIHGREFRGISSKRAKQKLESAERLFRKVNLPVRKIFRPPGWGMSKGTLVALRELEYTALAHQPSHSRTFEVGEYAGFKTIPQNYSIKEDPAVALEMAQKFGKVFAKGHIAYRHGREKIENGMKGEYRENIKNLLQALQETYSVRPVFLSDVVDETTHQM